ncbi:hypothetical protein HDU78_004897 [Chytriomyces hyalinus]|nr:hypothetical protein HDU78_004897 [Chytriomyces hyalinus]
MMQIGRKPTARRMGQLLVVIVMISVTLLLCRLKLTNQSYGFDSGMQWMKSVAESKLGSFKEEAGFDLSHEPIVFPEASPADINPLDQDVADALKDAAVEGEAQDRIDPNSSNNVGPMNAVEPNEAQPNVDQSGGLQNQVGQNEAADLNPEEEEDDSAQSGGSASLPDTFKFHPSAKARPFKSKAVVTFLATASSDDFRLQPLRDADWFFVGACLHAYTFLHSEKTRLQPSDDTEFVVMVTEFVPQPFQDTLLEMGARVLQVPSIEIAGREKPGDKYQYLYTKLNMYRLEGIYDSILFLDIDINYFEQSPVQLFSSVKPRKSPDGHPYYFGSTREWQNGNGIFNTGVQLLIPSIHHFNALLELAKDPVKTKYGDQGLLNVYFAGDGELPWDELPQFWNMNHLEVRNESEVRAAAGIHGKLWSECQFLSEASKPLFSLWRDSMRATRRIQMNILKNRYLAMPLVPAVPDTCDEWTSIKGMTTLKYQTAMSSFAMLTVGNVSQEVLNSREDFCVGKALAAHHVESPQKIRTLFDTLELLASRMLPKYDFVWVMNPKVEMNNINGAKFLTEFKEIRKRSGLGDVVYAFRDCAHGLSGSFVIASEGLPKLQRFLEKTRNTGQSTVDDDVVWELFIQLFTGNGGQATLQILDRNPWYEFPPESCQHFFHLKNFGMNQEGLYTKLESVPCRGVEFQESPVLPEDFVFMPSLSERPAKPKAIITLLAVAAPDFKTKQMRDADWFFSGALLNAYTFYHNPRTRLDPNGDVEFTIMITQDVPQPYIDAFLSLGARVLRVPAVRPAGREKPGDKYEYVYTKLQMQRLEAIYRGVLYIDVDLFFFNESPVSLFQYLDQHIANAKADPQLEPYFFGSTEEWKSHEKRWGQFNSGMQMFTPSLRQFNRLFEYAKDPDYARYGDQGLLTKYFEDNWFQLPQRYNTHHLEERNASSMEAAIGFHHKYWSDCHYMTAESAPSFLLWVRDAQAVRGLQLQHLEQHNPTSDVLIMPAIPADCDLWKKVAPEAIKQSVLFDTVAVLSTQDADADVLETRNLWAHEYNQASHITMQNVRSVAETVDAVSKLLLKYDWVWVQGKSAVFPKATAPVSLHLAKFQEQAGTVIAFEDCGRAATASILFSKSSLDGLAEFIGSVTSGDVAGDRWSQVLQVFSSKTPRTLRVIGEDHGLYHVDRNDCKDMFELEDLGES